MAQIHSDAESFMKKFVLVSALCVSLSAVAAMQYVSIFTQGDFRVIASNGIPNHETGKFPNRHNPNPILPKHYAFRVPLHPQIADKLTPTAWAWFGVAVNGVPIEPSTQEYWQEDRGSGWKYEAIGGEADLGIDMNLAHVQPNGAYHYHGLPHGLVDELGGDGKKMLLIGWAADGFPIYTGYGLSDAKDLNSPLRKMKSSYRLKLGERLQTSHAPEGEYDGNFTEDFEYVAGSGDLDECNGRFGVTPEFPNGIYHYYITEAFPMISRYWKGVADDSFQKHGPAPGTVPHKPRRPE